MAIENPKFGKGIVLAGGFDLGAKAPLDSRYTVATIEERDAHVTGNRAYDGMLVYVEADKKTYQYVDNAWVEFGFNSEKLEAEIVNDLTTGGVKKILSAEQGKVLKGLIDAEAQRADLVEKANAAAAKQAQDEVDALELVVATKAAQADLDALEELVGVLPEGTTATDVIDYVNIKTAGIATDAALGELQGKVNGIEGEVNTIKGDYLKAADKTELSNAVNAEKERAIEVEGGLNTRLATVEGDYLKAEHKTALEGLISSEESRAKAAEKVNADAIAAVKEDVDAFFKDATISEAAKDTLKEIQEYINSDVQGAAAMTESINGVKDRVKAIEDDYLVEADKTELTNAINGKVAQGDHDALAGRVSAVEGAVATKAEQSALNEVSGKVTVLEGKVDVEKVSTAISAAIAAQDFSGFTTDAEYEELSGKVTTAEGKIAALEAKFGEGEGTVEDLIADAKQEAIDAAAADAKSKAEAAQAAAVAHANGLDQAMGLRVDALVEEAKTYALKTEVETVDGRVTTLINGDVATLKSEMATTKTDIGNNKIAIQTHGEQIATKASQQALDDVIADLGEVETLANNNKTGLANAVERIGALETADEAQDGLLAGLRTDVNLKATQADLELLAGRVTTAEGEIDTLQSEMNAVEELAAANKASHEANAAAIKLLASQEALNAVSGRVKALEDWHADFKEATADEINNLFN